jgi:hypothetical protein
MITTVSVMTRYGIINYTQHEILRPQHLHFDVSEKCEVPIAYGRVLLNPGDTIAIYPGGKNGISNEAQEGDSERRPVHMVEEKRRPDRYGHSEGRAYEWVGSRDDSQTGSSRLGYRGAVKGQDEPILEKRVGKEESRTGVDVAGRAHQNAVDFVRLWEAGGPCCRGCDCIGSDCGGAKEVLEELLEASRRWV